MSGENLSRLDGDIQMILWWGEGAGGVFGKGTGRAIGIVEIQDGLAILYGLGVAVFIACCVLKRGFGISGFLVPGFFTLNSKIEKGAIY